eukprot:1158470-Pelagomonas_calceolata.AAC.9
MFGGSASKRLCRADGQRVFIGLLIDKENLEDAVRKQHDLIEKQSEELKYLRNKLEEQDKELNTARCRKRFLEALQHTV